MPTAFRDLPAHRQVSIVVAAAALVINVGLCAWVFLQLPPGPVWWLGRIMLHSTGALFCAAVVWAMIVNFEPGPRQHPERTRATKHARSSRT